MRDLVMRALDTARQRGADYADTRVVRFQSESVAVRNRNVEALTSDESLGFGVRVIVDGFWGFAGSHKMTLKEADTVAAEAVRIAKASARVRGPQADVGPPQGASGTYHTPVQQDPFSVSLDDKIALLLGGGQPVLPAGGENLRQHGGRLHRTGTLRDRLRDRGHSRRRG
jgi:TldD protein